MIWQLIIIMMGIIWIFRAKKNRIETAKNALIVGLVLGLGGFWSPLLEVEVVDSMAAKTGVNNEK